jgi:hypothetical protein
MSGFTSNKGHKSKTLQAVNLANNRYVVFETTRADAKAGAHQSCNKCLLIVYVANVSVKAARPPVVI